MPSVTQENNRAINDLIGKIYERLLRVASGVRRNSKATLTTTALVHEAYLKLMGSPELAAKPEDEFVKLAAHAMRQILTDRYRRKRTDKRGAGEIVFVTLLDPAERVSLSIEDLITVHEALDELELLDARLVRVVECRMFLDLTVPETATLLHCSETTVERQSRTAKAWLKRMLRSPKE
jgi:RNA polymerase sigma factor (TIGR02999 family)